MTMFALSQDKARPQAAQSGQIGIFFFAGRISARAPGLDLASAMKAEAPTLGRSAALQAEPQRCGPMMQAAQTGSSLQAGFASPRPRPRRARRPGSGAGPSRAAAAADGLGPPASNPSGGAEIS